MAKLYDLTTEKLRLAVGIDTKAPRLAWKISSDEKNITQTSYRVTVTCDSCGKTVWDSGVVHSNKLHVNYAGEPLLPARDYTWTVEVTLSNGEKITGKARFMTSLLDSGAMDAAKWISFPHTDNYTKETLPAFRRGFTTKDEVKSAKLFITGCGIYTAYINGERVSNLDENGAAHVNELTPGFTQAEKRKLYHSYDVTHMIKTGANAISAISASGWWSDNIVNCYGNFSAIRALLILRYADGSEDVIPTDESWRVSNDHPVREASVYHGETYDARYSTDFAKADFDDKGWVNAAESGDFTGIVTAHRGEPITCREDLCRSAVKIYTYRGAKNADPDKGIAGIIDNVTEYAAPDFVLHPGETAVIDFGQNAAGREYFRLSAEEGTTVTVHHGEMLNDGNGARSRRCDGPEGSVYIENMRSARTTTTYIAAGKAEEEFRPLHTFYGFRYLSVTVDRDVHFLDFKGEVLTSVGYDSGKIEVGDEWVNRLISNGRWGMYSNYLSVPTDCPQRDERLGWTADTQVFTTTAQYYSTAAQSFLEKWMQDMRDVQKQDGSYCSVAPLGPFGTDGGALGWADAGILAPYYVWQMSGDSTIVKEHYASMKEYVDGFLASRGLAGPKPCYGDWLSFEPNDDALQVYLGVCYYAWDAMVMAEMAEALGEEADAARYREIYKAEREYFIKTYVNEDGSVKLPQQTAALFALRLKLLPDEKSIEAVKKQLLDNIHEKGSRLQTGFLGTSILLPTLSENGMNDMAYTLLLQDEMPSWLYSVKAGATTVWERWNSYSTKDGFGDVGMNSFNHYAYGCVVEWMFRCMAGIRPGEESGFESFILAPMPDRRIGHVSAEYDSVCGKIRSAWRYDGEKLIYDCTVPANTTSTLVIPTTGEKVSLTSGTYHFEW